MLLCFQPHVPSIFSIDDTTQIVNNLLKSKSDVSLYCDTIVVSATFVNNCSRPFDKLMNAKAEKVR